jgi:hypothetical protein
MNADLAARVRQALADADQSFAASGDTMEALSWVAFAAKHGEPIPPHIAAWLHKALSAYRAGTAQSIDAALGLVSRRPPRRAQHERGQREAAIGRMYVLHSLGATIDAAATLVARLSPEFTHDTLCDRYKRSGMGRKAMAERKVLQERYHWKEVEAILAEYPDTPMPVKEAKEGIRKVYASSRI